MRKLVFGSVVAVGAVVGLATAVGDGAPTAAVMALVGVLIAAPIGAALAGYRNSSVNLTRVHDEDEYASSTSPEALAANFWRDKGHPPFMKPSDAEPDKHMFDPDKIV